MSIRTGTSSETRKPFAFWSNRAPGGALAANLPMVMAETTGDPCKHVNLPMIAVYVSSHPANSYNPFPGCLLKHRKWHAKSHGVSAATVGPRRPTLRGVAVASAPPRSSRCRMGVCVCHWVRDTATRSRGSVTVVLDPPFPSPDIKQELLL